MLAEIVAAGLIRTNIAAASAIVVVLGLRVVVARSWGADAAWRLWRVVPAAGVASLFPGLTVWSGEWLSVAPASTERWAAPFDGVWLAGVLTSAVFTTLQETAFRRRAARGLAGPAVMGALWPRLVTPYDFSKRFTLQQRALIVAHERAHIIRGDTRAILVIAVGRSLAWFNPFIHLAGRFARLDQELACDAQVLANRPHARRAYAEALLSVEGAQEERGAASCSWCGRPTLEVRLRATSRHIERSTPVLGSSLLGWSPVLAALLVWAAQPADEGRAIIWRRPSPVIFVDLTPTTTRSASTPGRP